MVKSTWDMFAKFWVKTLGSGGDDGAHLAVNGADAADVQLDGPDPGEIGRRGGRVMVVPPGSGIVVKADQGTNTAGLAVPSVVFGTVRVFEDQLLASE